MPTGYTKITSTGTDPCIILDARQAFIRKTGLTMDWRRVRIGAVLSICGLGDANSAPVAEQLGRDSFADDFYFGLTDSPNGHPGDGATRFVGLGLKDGGYNRAVALSVGYSAGWKPWGVYDYSEIFCCTHNRSVFSGYTSGLASGSGTKMVKEFPVAYDPTSATNYAFWLGCDVSLAYGVAPRVSSFGSNIPSGLMSSGESSDVLRSLVTATGMAKLISGELTSACWWADASTAPVGCQYLYIRYPFRNNRLRIHAIGAVQLA